METCTFFGHRDAPEQVGEILQEVLIDLIENEGVSMFYVGNHGKFDRIALGTLRSLKKKYPHIRYAIARRNKWMVEMSGYVIAYVKCNVGGAARYKTLAEKKGKTVLNLAQLMK